ncbi:MULTISPECIES: ABC transporter ATP-binding protein [Haloferax]|uniref:Probable branched-chain amino acid transport ATP-binding protein LivG n=2 Tax=Haloferax TaxID=2251 RepID=A0A6G1Z6T5_9EURY|nr:MULTISPECIES: ABC transporter ATP-binding protein [Haloferax]KAB1185027.1 ABC transporter ATP-binding protein [Haloferax sp. CBA1149]MRW82203.1 ATP-binding cassette domain-containing protein [Haloferax marinisediminis]
MAAADDDSFERDGETLLTVEGVGKRFAGLQALDNVDMTVKRGEIIGLIGPNGAGKTTLFNCISGVFPPTSGTVTLEGEDVSGMPSHKIARAGLARTFQITRPLEELTVAENVMVGAHIHTRRRGEARDIAMESLEFVGLADRADEEAGELTVGAQKRLELARAIATQPSILLLDEIMAGLTPQESKQMLGLFRQLRERGTSLLIIEHDMKAIMNISDYVKVLDQGQGIAFGKPAEVVEDDRVIEAYIGGFDVDA